MSQLAGTPVRLQFMRWDEHGWDNFGPAQLMPTSAAASTRKGKIVAFEYTGVPDARHLADGDDPTRQHVGLAARHARAAAALDTDRTRARSTTCRTGA